MPVKGIPSLAPLFTQASSPIEEVDRERNGPGITPIASSEAYADEDATVMVPLVDEEAVNVVTVETVEEEEAATSGDEGRVYLKAVEVTVVETAVEATVVETAVEVTVVTVVEEVTVPSCVRWCGCVR